MDIRATEYADDRQERSDAMWRRFCELMLDQGLSDVETLAKRDSVGKRNCMMREWLSSGALRGFGPASALEAFDLGVMQFQARQPEQGTQARPGSCAKICTLTERLMRGEELFHRQDLV
jgi:hypothetical protein